VNWELRDFDLLTFALFTCSNSNYLFIQPAPVPYINGMIRKKKAFSGALLLFCFALSFSSFLRKIVGASGE
jgi:hypothetical protein